MGSTGWIPRPDPALRVPLAVGIRPHRHRPNTLHGWVFLQHQVWVDYWGNEHEIDSMPLDYVTNVIAFCEKRAARLRLIAFAEGLHRVLSGADLERSDELDPALLESLSDLVVRDQIGIAGQPLIEWLHTTPVVRALDRQLPQEPK